MRYTKENAGVMLLKQIAVFVFGGVGYGGLEILWRGYTHWSMLLTGGVCLTAIYRFYQKYKDLPIGIFCLLCGIIITLFELLAGILVNVIGRMDVWDYSKYRFHLLGQICLPYSILWCLLGIPIKVICTKLDEFFCA